MTTGGPRPPAGPTGAPRPRAGSRTGRRSAGRAPLERPFLLWLGGSLLSQTGDAVLYFALGWAAAAHGGTWTAAVLSTVVLPRVVLLLVGGAVSDRRSPWTVMVWATGAMVATCTAFVAVAAAAGLPLWLLVSFGLVVGTVDAFFLPAAGSVPRLLVGAARLPRALALRQTGAQLVTMVGAPLGGVLVAGVGVAGTAVVDAVSFGAVLAVLVVLRPRPVPRPPAVRGHLLADAAAGVRLAAGHPVLRPGLVVTAAVAGAAVPVPTLVVPLLARAEHLSPGLAGLVVGAQSAGAILVAVLVSRWGALPRPGATGLAGVLVVAGGVGAFACARSPGLLVASSAVAGVGVGVFVAHVGPLLLGAAPDGYLSRVQAVVGLVQSLALLLSNPLLGAVADIASPRAAASGCAAVLAATAAGAARSRAFRTATL